MKDARNRDRDVPLFDRKFFCSSESITRIGGGELGGKASGLIVVRDLLADRAATTGFPGIDIYVPKMVVVATDLFDAFLDRNDLRAVALAGLPDERVADSFMRSELPAEMLGDLRALIQEVRTPLAVRSSSLLEDALLRPFAGVYETKMVPNNQPDADTRFRKLLEAVKFVYASTFFGAARDYVRATDRTSADEKMAIIIQEIVGNRFGERFYPEIAGVGRSYNFFPAKGVDPKDGVVNLALGLGKTIVDGGSTWTYSPARPKAPPPFGSTHELLRQTQLDFWAVNMGRPPAYSPLVETEYLVKADLAAADYDDTLSLVASTYDAQRDRLVQGTGVVGPRVLNFAPILSSRELALNELIQQQLANGESALGEAVEIEFAVTLPKRGAQGARFGFLQLRPMLVSEEQVSVDDDDLDHSSLLLASDRVMGNGVVETIRDIVYVKPGSFESRFTPQIVTDLERLNRRLVEQGSNYLLIGFGRWGSSDPWLGIPVTWGQISGARVIVESTLAGMDVEPSQGAHFFHNIISFRVCYLCVRHEDSRAGFGRSVDWAWLDGQVADEETDHVRHVRLDRPFKIKVDGRSGRGGIWHP